MSRFFVDYKKLLYNSFKKLEDVSSCFTKETLEKIDFFYFKNKIYHEPEKSNTNLFILFGAIFPFIINEERKNDSGLTIDEDVLTDYCTLSLLIFLTYSIFDQIIDDGESQLLPIANIYFRETILLAVKLNIDIVQSHTGLELYNLSPKIIRVGKINLERAINYDKEWFLFSEGFDIAVCIVEDFVTKFIKNSSYDWILFYKNYLIFRQLMDDINDFVEDYQNGELKSMGILALVKKFGHKKTINLKNPITAFRYQLFIYKNIPKLRDELLNKYYKYLKNSNLDVEKVKKTVKKFENCLGNI